MGEFLRILVQFDIRKPLRRCVLLGDSTGKEASPRLLRYERLPEFCFFCGLVGHKLSDCTLKPAVFDDKKLPYGSWLRVQTQQPRQGPRKRYGIKYFADSDLGATDAIPDPPLANQNRSPSAYASHTAGNQAAVDREMHASHTAGNRDAAAAREVHEHASGSITGTPIEVTPTPASTEGTASTKGIRSSAAPIEPRAAPVDPLVPKHFDAGAMMHACHVAKDPDPVLHVVDTEPVLPK
ncbi:hypothetical protein V6N12_013774 [Hibiscus sabdariffa]|uniref:Zinc knuckle CX2CX4HX4C domain-containing protein n=1 Tax=Hibiscus sabdariffa TaxID=183260 RepID=A0ABR2CV94_9ROSI